MKRLVAHTSDSKLREFPLQSSDAHLRLFVTFFGEEGLRQVFYICRVESRVFISLTEQSYTIFTDNNN
jgi:hypothetical protein